MILRAAIFGAATLVIAPGALPLLAQVSPELDAPAGITPPPERPDAEDRIDEPGMASPDAEAAANSAAGEDAPLWQTLAETPEDLEACLADLRALGSAFALQERMTGEIADCGIANPVEVTEILPGVALRPEAVMRCATARALATWVAESVVPSARRTGTLAPLAAIDHGSTYVCRNRGGVSGRRLSEHAVGNAVDVMGFIFDDDTVLRVEPRADAGTIEEAFQRSVRGGACLDFTTVIGPGTDEAHADHLHLDIKKRRGGYRICQ